jgi:selenophosphate synthetase-related protein
MIGEIKREDFISAKTAQIGDNIIIISDFDGKVGKANILYWDTVTFKNSEDILEKRKVMNVIAKKHLANASKDISNGGIFGTILQLIKYSNVGADVSIKKIQIPQKLINLNYTLEKYIRMYLTTSFIISASNNNSTQLIKIVNEHGLHANIIGTIIKEKNLLKINDDKETIDVIKF